MPFIPRQEAFTCEHCGKRVEPIEHGSYRNHCPHCLYSKHVDAQGPGDRASSCGGLMKPVAIDQRSGKGFVLLHACEKCGKQIPNRAAADDDLASFEQIF
ncbi:MAG: RNHCP domain-containing protein [Candidatus Peribacteraceae bacterium]|nr:RNHCP domain-containing protein [Candidatus Peribacteraceae bacterium]